jgi:hypothetical protein
VVLRSNIAFCGVDDGDSERVKLAGFAVAIVANCLLLYFCFERRRSRCCACRINDPFEMRQSCMSDLVFRWNH